MSYTRREFVKNMGKGVGASAFLWATSDRIGDLLAQSPTGRVLESKFKGLSDIALLEGKLAGCSYADIRFQRNLGLPGVNASASNAPAGAGGGGFGGRGGGGRGGGGGGGGGGFGGGGGGGRGGRGGGGGNEADGTPRAAGGSACASSMAACGDSPAARSSPRRKFVGLPAWPLKWPKRVRSPRRSTCNSRRLRRIR